MKHDIVLKINNETHRITVDSRRTLLEVIREEIGLTGTKEMCNKGDCGSCTVLLDGRPVLSCMMLAVEADGKEILTIEGLAGEKNSLHPIQQAFVESGAIQCGYCTPGFIMSAKALLDKNKDPNVDEIKNAISNHICRCTGYVQIIEAIGRAAKILGGVE
ncbi:MAG: (2Fe-2S)-binding protein [Syntrophorhabdaceae bacterium]|nr:(2Fe-2S)-binding protein [Syntrophorhabdaceae bacterium]